MGNFDSKFQAEVWVERNEDDMIQPLLNGFSKIYEGVLNTIVIEELQKDLFDNNYDQFISVLNGSWVLVDVDAKLFHGEGDHDNYFEFTYTNIIYTNQ